MLTILVTQKIVSRYGKQYTWDIKSKMMGMRQKEAAELLIRELDLETDGLTPDAYLLERNRLQSELFPSARPLPGVLKLVNHFKKLKIPMAVATSSHRDAFRLKTMNNSKLFELFDLVVTGDDPDVKNGKPHPDIFLVAAKRLETSDNSRVLVFEDAISGVKAAQSAGMKVCWVPDPNLDRSAITKPVDLCISSLEEFDPKQFGLKDFD